MIDEDPSVCQSDCCAKLSLPSWAGSRLDPEKTDGVISSRRCDNEIQTDGVAIKLTVQLSVKVLHLHYIKFLWTFSTGC
jgi:hypothetical protein